MKAWIISIGAIFLLAIILIVGPLLLPTDQYRRIITRELSERLPYSVKVGDVKLRLIPRPAFIVKNAQFVGGEGFEDDNILEIKKMRGDISWSTLFTGKLKISLKLSGATMSVRCKSGKCNTDKFLTHNADEIKNSITPPIPNKDVPVLSVPNANLLNFVMSTAYANDGNKEVIITTLDISESEVRFYSDGAMRLAILNIYADIDPLSSGYSVVLRAGQSSKPILAIKGALLMNRKEGVLRTKELRGWWQGVLFKSEFEYCASCNPKLTSWNLAIPRISTSQVGSILSQFDVSIPQVFDWSGSMSFVFKNQPINNILIDVDFTQASIFWKNVFSKQADVPLKLSLNLEEEGFDGNLSSGSERFLLKGNTVDDYLNLKFVASDFDWIALKGFLPIFSDIESFVKPRIEGSCEGSLKTFPDDWTLSAVLSADEIKAYGLKVKHLNAALAVDNGVVFPRIEGDIWGGKLSGEGEISNEEVGESRFGVIVSNAKLGLVPVAETIFKGQGEVLLNRVERLGRAVIDGSLLSENPSVSISLKNMINELNRSWKKMGGESSISSAISGELSDLRISFENSYGEYVIKELNANLGKSKLFLNGNFEPITNSALFKGKISVIGGKKLAGKRFKELVSLNKYLVLPIKSEGKAPKFTWDIDEDELKEFREKQLKEIVEEKPKPKPVAKPKTKKVRSLRKKKPVVKGKARKKKVKKEEPKKEEDVFKIIIGK